MEKDHNKTLVYLDEMTWTEVCERLKVSKIALVPVGSMEEHGRHLPLGTDNFELMEIIKRGVELVAEEVKPIVTPLIPYGWDEDGINWPGTISLRNQTVRAILRDTCMCLIKHGFKKIIIMDGCGGNYPAIDPLVHEVAFETGAFIVHYRWFATTGRFIEENKLREAKIEELHAGEIETSLAMACGVRTRMDLAEGFKGWPDFLIRLQKEYNAQGSWPRYEQVTESGALGDPAFASKQKGEKILNYAANKLANLLKELKNVEDPYRVGVR